MGSGVDHLESERGRSVGEIVPVRADDQGGWVRHDGDDHERDDRRGHQQQQEPACAGCRAGHALRIDEIGPTFIRVTTVEAIPERPLSHQEVDHRRVGAHRDDQRRAALVGQQHGDVLRWCPRPRREVCRDRAR